MPDIFVGNAFMRSERLVDHRGSLNKNRNDTFVGNGFICSETPYDIRGWLNGIMLDQSVWGGQPFHALYHKRGGTARRPFPSKWTNHVRSIWKAQWCGIGILPENKSGFLTKISGNYTQKYCFSFVDVVYSIVGNKSIRCRKRRAIYGISG